MNKKKMIAMLIAVLLIVSLTGCGATESKKDSGNADKAPQKVEVTVAPEETPETTELQKKGKIYTSEYGYHIEYDDSLFEVINDEGNDCIQLKDQDVEKEVPVYVAISKAADSAKNMVDGLILQSGKDGLKADTTTIGKGNYKSQCIVYDTKEERGKVYHTFHVVEAGGTVILIEICNGSKVEPQVQNAMEEMIASFEMGKMSKTSAKKVERADYSVFTDMPADKVKAFADSIQANFADKDWDALAKKISYPITIKSKKYQSITQLCNEDFGSFFSKAFVEAVANTDTNNLFANAEGAMFGDGEIWFAECVDKDGRSKGLKITRFNI